MRESWWESIEREKIGEKEWMREINRENRKRENWWVRMIERENWEGMEEEVWWERWEKMDKREVKRKN